MIIRKMVSDRFPRDSYSHPVPGDAGPRPAVPPG